MTSTYKPNNPERKKDGTYPVHKQDGCDLYFDTWEELLAEMSSPPQHD